MGKNSGNIEVENLLQITIFDTDNNEIRFIVNGIEYVVTIPNSKIKQIHKNIIEEINKKKELINTVNNALLKDIENLPHEKYKNGEGKKADRIANKYKISVASVYEAKKILDNAPKKILNKFCSGEISIKTANKLIKKNLVEKSKKK